MASDSISIDQFLAIIGDVTRSEDRTRSSDVILLHGSESGWRGGEKESSEWLRVQLCPRDTLAPMSRVAAIDRRDEIKMTVAAAAVSLGINLNRYLFNNRSTVLQSIIRLPLVAHLRTSPFTFKYSITTPWIENNSQLTSKT